MNYLLDTSVISAVAPTRKNRPTAILSGDVAGYSRLMAEDEAARKNLRVARRIDNILI